MSTTVANAKQHVRTRTRTRTRTRPANSTLMAGPILAARSASSNFYKLVEAEANVQEVYLYSWMQFLGASRRQNPFMTHLSEMRYGVPLFEGSDYQIKPCKMAPNTIAATILSLEEKGLIVIERLHKGRKVELSIFLPE